MPRSIHTTAVQAYIQQFNAKEDNISATVGLEGRQTTSVQQLVGKADISATVGTKAVINRATKAKIVQQLVQKDDNISAVVCVKGRQHQCNSQSETADIPGTINAKLDNTSANSWCKSDNNSATVNDK